MEENNKAIIFLIATSVVIIVCVYLTVLLDIRHLPDGINVVVILLMSYAPAVLMLYYWTNRFYFKKLNRQFNEKKNGDVKRKEI